MTKYRLVKFNTSSNYKSIKIFDCNNDMINTFVHKSLKKRVKKHLSQAYVLLRDDTFSGFYTLDTFSIAKDMFETELKPSALPPVVPVVKLGMLAVDKNLQGQGLGKRLLRDAMLKVAKISELSGCAGIYLLAEEDAVAFYESLGFIKIKEDTPSPMFLSIEQVLNAVEA
jgi:GNAT superfamily N-acetyltransferase